MVDICGVYLFELAQVYLLTQKSATCQTINLYTAGKLGEKLAGKRIEDVTSFNKLAKKISFPNTQWGWSFFTYIWLIFVATVGK